jgi:Holliday junction DNA helicase RuvB
MKNLYRNYVGQRKIVNELNLITLAVMKDRTRSISILFRGSAGCGKTHLARMFLSKVCGDRFSYQIPSENRGLFVMTPNIANFRGHFVDEVHEVKNIEAMYNYMNEKNKIIVSATNEGGELPDAFLSRNIVFVFQDYSLGELALILRNYGKDRKFKISTQSAMIIADKSRGSPRVAKMYLDRIMLMIDSGYYKKSLRGINAAFKDIGVYEGGYTDLDMRYLSILHDVGQTSLNNLCRLMKLDMFTIKNTIEPFLLEKGHIEITSRGRKFLTWSTLEGGAQNEQIF